MINLLSASTIACTGNWGWLGLVLLGYFAVRLIVIAVLFALVTNFLIQTVVRCVRC